MKAWKSEVIEGSISMKDLHDLVSKTLHIPEGAVFRAFVTWGNGGVLHQVEIGTGLKFEVLLKDASDATKQG